MLILFLVYMLVTRNKIAQNIKNIMQDLSIYANLSNKNKKNKFFMHK